MRKQPFITTLGKHSPIVQSTLNADSPKPPPPNRNSASPTHLTGLLLKKVGFMLLHCFTCIWIHHHPPSLPLLQFPPGRIVLSENPTSCLPPRSDWLQKESSPPSPISCFGLLLQHQTKFKPTFLFNLCKSSSPFVVVFNQEAEETVHDTPTNLLQVTFLDTLVCKTHWHLLYTVQPAKLCKLLVCMCRVVVEIIGIRSYY